MASFKRNFIFFIIVLTIGLGILGYFYYQKNLYSKEILKLEILGPTKTNVSQEVEYIVKYKNNGDIRLEDPELIFEYPEHSLPIGYDSLRIVKEKEELGDAIYPGEEKTIFFKARLFGRENEVKIARAVLSYRPKDLKAFYESSTTFSTVIEKVPISFDFDLPSKLESGKDIHLGLVYYSNLEYPLSDMRIKIEYPSEFEFIKSDPQGLEKNEWELPRLNRNQGGRIEVDGKLMGKIGEQKVFRARLGMWREGEFVLLKELNWAVEIIKPSLYIFQQINGNPEYIASPGDLLHYEIFFKNIGEGDLTNLFLMVKLEGEPLDILSLKSDRGDFEPGDNSIIFDWRRNPDLQFLSAREEGEVEFWISLKENWEIKGKSNKNPSVKNRIYLNQIWQEFETKVNSRLEISQKGYFDDAASKEASLAPSGREIFGNSGPIPPKVGETTTYTIMWQAKNYYNDVENVKVKAILPQHASLTGKIFPEEEIENFAFDSKSREIIWSLEEMEMGKGILDPAPNLSFQIAFQPDSAQRGKTPEIIGEVKITGEDKWTGQSLQATTSAVNTTLPDDETITEKQGIVQ